MPEFNAFQLIICLGLVNGLILLLSLSSLPKKFRKSAKILGWFILGYTAYISNWTIFASIGFYHEITPLWIPSLYFLPALTYLFSKSIITSDGLSKTDVLFFIPGIIDAVFQVIKWIWYLTYREGYYFPLDNRNEFFIYEGIGLLFATFCIYKIILMIRSASFKKNDAFRFYRYAFFFLLFVLFRWMTVYAIDYFRPALLTFNLQFAFWSVDLVFFLVLGYRSLIAPGKYVSLIPHERNTRISEEASGLISLIKEEKLYLDPEFSRKHLSEKTGMPDTKISALITNQLDTTFYVLVNELRANESRKLLDAGAANRLTMEAVARNSGFRSKTTFYKFFKGQFGLRPTDYIANKG